MKSKHMFYYIFYYLFPQFGKLSKQIPYKVEITLKSWSND